MSDCEATLPVFRKVVSLGGWCGTAAYLQFKKWKTESYPSDWNRMPPQALLYCLRNDFGDVTENTPELLATGFIYAHGKISDPDFKAYMGRCADRFRALKALDVPVLCMYITRPITKTEQQAASEDELREAVGLLPKHMWLLFICRELVEEDQPEAVDEFRIDFKARFVYARMRTHHHVDTRWATPEHRPLLEQILGHFTVDVLPHEGTPEEFKVKL